MDNATRTPDQTSPVGGGSVLSGERVRELGIVLEADDAGWRGCGYDLSAETVIDYRGNVIRFRPQRGLRKALSVLDFRGKAIRSKRDESVEIPAHGMVEVIARERVKMPDNVVGYAMVKTGLTINGIFALNIGIIDPHYEGGVSTTLINFGKNPFELKKGAQFLRLTFHNLSRAVKWDGKAPVTAEKYLEERRKKAEQHFSETFLDIATTAESAARHILDDWQKRILIWAPALAILLTLVTFSLNFSQVFGTHRHSVTNDEVHNICMDVARILQDEQHPQKLLSKNEVDSLCLRRSSETSAPMKVMIVEALDPDKKSPMTATTASNTGDAAPISSGTKRTNVPPAGSRSH